eukprot:8571729-Karenia_brevis.AAC.1
MSNRSRKMSSRILMVGRAIYVGRPSPANTDVRRLAGIFAECVQGTCARMFSLQLTANGCSGSAAALHALQNLHTSPHTH